MAASGRIDVSSLKAALSQHEACGKKTVDEFLLMCDEPDKLLPDFLGDLCCRSFTSKQSLLPKVCGQLLVHIANLVEKKFLTCAVSRGNSGDIRTIRRVASDVAVTAVESTPIYLPRNPRHVDRELVKYNSVSRDGVGSAQFLSIAGPDATKIGTQFAVMASAAMNSESGILYWCAPHDPTL